MYLHNRGTSASPSLILTNAAGQAGRATQFTYPYEFFEESVLQLLKEVKPGDVLPRDKIVLSTVDVLRAKLANIRKDIDLLHADLRTGYSKHLSAVLREHEAEEEEVAGQLQDELAKSARPAEKAMKEFRTLSDMIKKEGDPARLRIRPVLRGFIEEAWVLFVRRDTHQLAAVQLFFQGGAHRDYLLAYQPARFRHSGKRWSRSLADILDDDTMDLRRREDALALEESLRELDLAKLENRE
jgi:hypothetical protein